MKSFKPLMVVLVIILGLFTNIGVYVWTSFSTVDHAQSKSDDAVCNLIEKGGPTKTQTVKNEAGWPFISSIETVDVNEITCGGAPIPQFTMSVLMNLMATWQFFVDWIIWSFACVGGLYVLGIVQTHTRRNNGLTNHL